MEPTQNGGNSNIPGVKPGVIASGADTPGVGVSGAPNVSGMSGVSGTVGASNMSGASGTVGASNMSGASGTVGVSSTSNMPGLSTGRAAMQTKPIVPQPMNMVVVDGGGGPKKSRRGLLIAGIALIGVALIVGVVALLMMNGGNNNGGVKVEVAFNNMAKYMLFGNAEAIQSISDAEIEDATFFEKMQEGDYKAHQEYFNMAKDYIDVFRKAAKDEFVVQVADSLASDVNLLSGFSALAYTNVLWETYLDAGNSGMENYIAELNGSISTDGTNSEELDIAKRLVNVTGEIYSAYTSAGCVNDDKELDTECIDVLVEDNEPLNETIATSALLRVDLRNYVRILSNSVFSMILQVNERFEDVQVE